MTTQDQLISSGDAARMLGVAPTTLLRWATEGKIAPALVTPGGHTRWRRSDIEALLNGGGGDDA